MYFTYILKQNDNEYYIGSTSDLEKRVKDHNAGKNPSTKNKRPVKIIWYAKFRSKSLAQDFEKYLKSSSGYAFRNKRLI